VNAAYTGAKAWSRLATVVLPIVAIDGAVLSWGSLYEAAARALGPPAPVIAGVNTVGAAFPLLVDMLILGASARYVAGVKDARPVGGWRATAHAGIAGTIALNAAAAPTWAGVPWHVAAPIVWSALVELVARDVLGQLRAVQDLRSDRIPAKLWVTRPGESARTAWRMARTIASTPAVEDARLATQRCAAVQDLVRATGLPAHARRQVLRRLWSGAIDPSLLASLVTEHGDDPRALHLAALRAIAGHPVPDMAPDTAEDGNGGDPGSSADAADAEAQQTPSAPRILHLAQPATPRRTGPPRRGLTPTAVRAAAEAVAADVADGRPMPSQKAVKTRFRCGAGTAVTILTAAARITATTPTGEEAPSEQSQS
jgi:hypothetical protein